jgi:ABC-type sugar transport system ATPase subunit
MTEGVVPVYGREETRRADGPAGSPLLAARGIAKSFGGVKALQGVDFAVDAGTLHAIAGENGAGKSTLIKIIMGVLLPDAGELLVDGQVVRVSSPAVARRLGFAAVHQEALVYPQLSALENLFMVSPIRNRHGSLDWASMRKAATPVLESIGGDPGMLQRRMGDLRLGHQQLILVTQALLQSARLIVFDEPTAILSAGETDHLFEIIASLKKEGKAIAYISHRVEELARIADEVTVLTDGKVAGRMRKEELDVGRLVSLMTRGETRLYSRAPECKVAEEGSGEVELEVEGLTRTGMYEDVSWQVRRGEVLGLYGQVGSGRSEMALGIFGSMPRESGVVRLEGREVRIRSPRQAIKLGMGFLPEDRKTEGIFAIQSVTWNATSVVFPSFSGFLYNVARGKLVGVAQRFREQLSIRVNNLSDPIGSLSGGGQQKVVLGRWLATHLKVLVLDEPTRGIDVVTKSQFHQLIRQVADEGLAVVMISSDLPEILAVADRVLVMRAGRVAKSFDHLYEVVPEDLVSAAIGSGDVAKGSNEAGVV